MRDARLANEAVKLMDVAIQRFEIEHFVYITLWACDRDRAFAGASDFENQANCPELASKFLFQIYSDTVNQ